MQQVMICRFCDRECRMIVSVEKSGNPIAIRPEYEKGTICCPTGMHAIELMNNKRRIKTPLKKVTIHGCEQWKEISWEEATDFAAEKLKETLQRYGTESLLMVTGFNKPVQNAVFNRLANVLGVVNRAGSGNMCHMAQSRAFADTFGFSGDRKITEKTKTVLLWGSNPSNTMRWVHSDIVKMKKAGGRLIVVDPLPTRMTEIADLWLPIRPGTDAVLALGMMKLILEKEWEDKKFLEECTSGLEEVRKASETYTLKFVANQTGLEEEQILTATEWFANNGPAIIFGGNALDHNLGSYQKGRCLAILLALTGNVDKEGTVVPMRGVSSPVRSERMTRSDLMQQGWQQGWQKKMYGWNEKLLDNSRLTSGHEMLHGIQNGSIHMGWVLGSNPVLMWADSHRTAKILEELDFLIVQDFFLTPTAMKADLFLPAATYMEYENVFIEKDGSYCFRPALIKNSMAKSDMEIISIIANKIGFSEYFWKDEESFWNEFLADTDITFSQLKSGAQYKAKVEVSAPQDYRKKGFPTVDGKVRLSIPELEKKASSVVPVYQPLSDVNEEYPYYCTNYKPGMFFLSAGRQMEGQKRKQSDPIVYVSKDIAKKENLRDGEWITVATSVGEVRQKVKIPKKMAHITIGLASGWWNPDETEWDKILAPSSNNIVSAEKLLGTEIQAFSCRGIACCIKKEKEW